MSMAKRVRWYLDHHHIAYDVMHHAPTSSTLESADAAGVRRDEVAKCVLLEDERGYLMAVLPASRRIEFARLRQELHRALELAGEGELEAIFDDCQLGSIPVTGRAYHIPVLVDRSLINRTDVYFEAGDHEDLVHVPGLEFLHLMSDAQFADFTRPC